MCLLVFPVRAWARPEDEEQARLRVKGELWGPGCRLGSGFWISIFPLSSRLALVLLVRRCTALTGLAAAFLFWRLFLFGIDTSEDRL